MSSPTLVKHVAAPTASATADTAARPKIMRRPPQLSAPTTAIILQAPSLNAAPIPPKAETLITNKPWQDDGRFAIALVLVIIVINVLVSAWLPGKPSARITHTISTQHERGQPKVTILNELNPPESNQ